MEHATTPQPIGDDERRYRLLVDMIPQQVWTADRGGRLTYVSRRVTEYMGVDLEQLSDDGWLEYAYPDDRALAAQAWHRALESGQPDETEFRLRGKDGAYRWFLFKAVPLRNDRGDIIQWFGTTTDIHEQKTHQAQRDALLAAEQAARAEAEARAREERVLREAVAAVTASRTTQDAVGEIVRAAIDATDADGAWATRVETDRVLLVANAGEVPPPLAVTPYEHSYTRRAIDANAPLRLGRAGDADAREWIAALPPEFLEYSLLVVPLIGETPIGGLFLTRAPGHPPFSEDEATRALTFGELAAMTFDRLKFMEDALHRREELERLSASRTRLIRGLSHDLKNPLGVADGFASLLEQGIGGALTDEHRESVRRIRNSIQLCVQLIEDLLDFARAEAGQLQLKREAVDLVALVREVVKDFRAQAEGNALTLDVQALNPLSTQTDPRRVRQIIGNLVSNAIKYSQPSQESASQKSTSREST